MRGVPSPLIVGASLVLACGCGTSATRDGGPPFKTVASVDQLMLGTIQHAAEVYWGSVSTVVDKDGIHEHFPQNDGEWTDAWSAAITIAESGNLLMMPERTRGAEWDALALQLVEVGTRAAQAAESRSADGVLEQGEKVYDVCTACHMKFVMGGEVP